MLLVEGLAYHILSHLIKNNKVLQITVTNEKFYYLHPNVKLFRLKNVLQSLQNKSKCRNKRLIIMVTAFKCIKRELGIKKIGPKLPNNRYCTNLGDNTWAQCYKNFYIRNLQMLVISLSVCTWQASPAQCFLSKAIAYPRLKHLSDGTLQGRLLALPTNIRLGWSKLLLITNICKLQT